MKSVKTQSIETSSLRDKFEESDIQKLAEILASGICDYLRSGGKGGVSKAAAKRAASALKTAREIGAKCSSNPTGNTLIKDGEDSNL